MTETMCPDQFRMPGSDITFLCTQPVDHDGDHRWDGAGSAANHSVTWPALPAEEPDAYDRGYDAGREDGYADGRMEGPDGGLLRRIAELEAENERLLAELADVQATRDLGGDADDREPQPTDGPDYHADHAAWAAVREHDAATPVEDWKPSDYVSDDARNLLSILRHEGVSGLADAMADETPLRNAEAIASIVAWITSLTRPGTSGEDWPSDEAVERAISAFHVVKGYCPSVRGMRAALKAAGPPPRPFPRYQTANAETVEKFHHENVALRAQLAERDAEIEALRTKLATVKEAKVTFTLPTVDEVLALIPYVDWDVTVWVNSNHLNGLMDLANRRRLVGLILSIVDGEG